MGALTPEGPVGQADRPASAAPPPAAPLPAAPDAWYCGCCGLVRPA